jgi:hypothetical protein
MDKRKNNGGSRKGAGRKKGSGFSGIIKKEVNSFMEGLLEKEEVKKVIIEDLIEMSVTKGYIYIIKDLDNNQKKIGVTQKSNPKQRLSQYVSHKMNIELLFIDIIDDCFEIEESIHSLFNEYRNNGDWFSLSNNDVSKIISIINKHKYSKIYNGRW